MFYKVITMENKENNENIVDETINLKNVRQSYYDDEKKKIVAKFIKESAITRKSISKYSPYFPDKAMRTLIESEVIYDVIQ